MKLYWTPAANAKAMKEAWVVLLPVVRYNKVIKDFQSPGLPIAEVKGRPGWEETFL
jgi:hypothetical protein